LKHTDTETSQRTTLTEQQGTKLNKNTTMQEGNDTPMLSQAELIHNLTCRQLNPPNQFVSSLVYRGLTGILNAFSPRTI
jgi:hypothetical protein